MPEFNIEDGRLNIEDLWYRFGLFFVLVVVLVLVIEKK
jgi:hypothetical protein